MFVRNSLFGLLIVKYFSFQRGVVENEEDTSRGPLLLVLTGAVMLKARGGSVTFRVSIGITCGERLEVFW